MSAGKLHPVWTIARRELSGYFASPVAFVFIVIFLLLTGFFTFMLGGFFERGEASLNNSFFIWLPWLYRFLGAGSVRTCAAGNLPPRLTLLSIRELV